MRPTDFKTMKPQDKYITPRPPPMVPGPSPVRLDTAPGELRAPESLRHRRSAGSLGPMPTWATSPRKLFSRKSSSKSEDGRELRLQPEALRSTEDHNLARPTTSRSAQMSPTSLKRFLEDDRPVRSQPARVSVIADDLDFDDDANFAGSSITEIQQAFGLSPPPPRGFSSPSVIQLAPLDEHEPLETPLALPSPRDVPQISALSLTAAPRSHFSVSSSSSSQSLMSPTSPSSSGLPSIYHSENEDEEESYPFPSTEEPVTETKSLFAKRLTSKFSGYSLPKTSMDNSKSSESVAEQSTPAIVTDSPMLSARNDSEITVGQTTFIAAPVIDAGLDDLVSELSWIADVIGKSD